jgi:hypothetical protein
MWGERERHDAGREPVVHPPEEWMIWEGVQSVLSIIFIRPGWGIKGAFEAFYAGDSAKVLFVM